MTGYVGDTRDIIMKDFEQDYHLSKTNEAFVVALKRRNERLKLLNGELIAPDLILAIIESKG